MYISLLGKRNKNAQNSTKVTRRPNRGAAEPNGITEAKEKGAQRGHSRNKPKMDEFTM